LFLRVHHSVADGIGFQSLMALLTDATPDASPPPAAPLRDESPPGEQDWLAQSARRFEAEERERPRIEAERARAKQALGAFEADPAHRKIRPARTRRTRASSNRRRYETLDLPLSRVRAAGRALGGTVNDAFLAIVSGAIRRYLARSGELPDGPLVAVGARSYRREEHGLFGNRIVNLMTSLATDLDDPAARFAEIRRASLVEIERSRLLEGLLREHDRPYGARDRRRSFEDTMQSGQRILPGQVVVSNVPGPAEPRFLAGHRLRASYPAPLLGYGRMLNVTLRRYLDELQLGIMGDAGMLNDVEVIRSLLLEAFQELEECARVKA
jgi:WS/DGAT/MGAT family acyltransferase